MSIRTALACALALAATACKTPNLPGTEIPDNDDTRAVAAVLDRYRAALELRDAGAVLALASPGYLDPSGTPEPRDDMDWAALSVQLPRDLAGLENVQVGFTLRRIDVEGDRAIAEVFFEQFYRVQTPAGAMPRRDADLHRFVLARAGKGQPWLFLSGL
jgi:hypothetical protein